MASALVGAVASTRGAWWSRGRRLCARGGRATAAVAIEYSYVRLSNGKTQRLGRRRLYLMSALCGAQLPADTSSAPLESTQAAEKPEYGMAHEPPYALIIDHAAVIIWWD